MSPYRRSPFEQLEQSRKEAEEEAVRKAKELNIKEKRSKLKGVLSKEKKPLAAVDVLQIEAEQEDKARRERFEKPIMEREAKALEAFFGKKIDVPPLPKEVTPEKLKKWEAMKMELHYLPEEDMTQEKNFPGWKKKPDYQDIATFPLPPDATKLPGSWILVDSRQKPAGSDGQMYKDDFLAPILEDFRRKKIVEKSKRPGSRFNISPEELEKSAVRKAFAQALDVDPENLSTPREIEFNVLGNMHHPEWGETNTAEWFSDQSDVVRRRLSGGSSVLGGLSSVVWFVPSSRFVGYGFRLLIVFPKK